MVVSHSLPFSYIIGDSENTCKCRHASLLFSPSPLTTECTVDDPQKLEDDAAADYEE